MAHTLTCRGSLWRWCSWPSNNARRASPPSQPWIASGDFLQFLLFFLCDQRSLSQPSSLWSSSAFFFFSLLLLFLSFLTSPIYSSPVLSCISYLLPLTILKPRRVDGPVNRNPGSPGAISVFPLVETLNLPCDLVRCFRKASQHVL